jgi:hypothetical protein
MLSKIHFSLLFALLMLGCNTKQSQFETNGLTVDQLLLKVESLIEKKVTVHGTVTHVCSHAGRRCFIIDPAGEKSIRIEALGQIESFSRELTGSDIKVKAVLKETRLTADEIDEWEIEVIEENPEDANTEGEHCSAEMSNIRKMRDWMKEHGKDYYSIYYLEGLSYELVK